MSKARVQWDEAKLAEIEADKPTRQKITEPKTPYHHTVDDDGDETLSRARESFEDDFDGVMHPEGMDPSLINVSSGGQKITSHTGWTSSEEEPDWMEQDEEGSDSERRRSFREQRKAHYNEFHAVNEFLRKESSLDDDDETGDTEIIATHPHPTSLTAGVKGISIEESPSQGNGS